jgi:ubiquinone/menaquinone biosynthesis C-methylase UbiE
MGGSRIHPCKQILLSLTLRLSCGILMSRSDGTGAAEPCEPRQVREGATVSESLWAPPASLSGRTFIKEASMSETPPVCNYEGSDYQTSFWEKGGRAYEDGCEAVALKRLLRPHGRHMLELGAGAGRNTLRYTGYDQITLVDYSRTQLLQARAHLGDSPRFRFVAADIYHLPFVNDTFDGATMIRTLHHMADAQRALIEIRRVLELDACFILEFANKRNWKSIFRWLLRKQSWSPYSREPIEFAALNFDFHPATVRSWLRTAGFKSEQVLTVSHFRSAFLKEHLPTNFLVGLDSALQWTGAFMQYTPSVFVRTRAISGGVQPKAEGLFACPACGAALKNTPPKITCPNCGRSYPVKDGIYDFRIDLPTESD